MKSLTAFCLSQRPLILMLFIALIGAGLFALQDLNVEANPHPMPPMLEVIAQHPSFSAEEMEQYVTVPLEAAVAGINELRIHRSISLPGLSEVQLQFSYGTDDGSAQQRVVNRLDQAELPNDVRPLVVPTNPTGEVFRYQLAGANWCSLLELKVLQDRVIRRRLRAIPGVIDVTGWGGLPQEYRIDIDLRKLIHLNIPLQRVFEQVSAANLNLGARTIDVGEQSVNVRGAGLLRTPKDLENVFLVSGPGAPVRLRDVATISVGKAQRSGVAGRDAQPDIVEGVVLMQRGENTPKVLDRIEAEVDRLNTSGELPPGVRIDPFYDRKELIGRTTRTVLETLLLEMGLIFAIHSVFVGDVRAAVIACTIMSSALCSTVILTVIHGDSANLSLFGALNFGIIGVPAAILVEHIYRRLIKPEPTGFPKDTENSFASRPFHSLAASCREVNKVILFSAAIILALFVPLFALQGVEGQIFAPLAKMYSYAMSGAIAATLLLAPVVWSYLFPRRVDAKEGRLLQFLKRTYAAALRASFRHCIVTIAASLILLLVCGYLATNLGTEFLPKSEEGNLWIRAILPPTMSLDAGIPYVKAMRDYLRSQPMVDTVVSQHGRTDDGTNPTGSSNAEFYVLLAPFSERARWGNVTKATLVDKLSADMTEEFPGLVLNFSQMIEDRTETALSGVNGENVVKVFGEDLETLEKIAERIRRAIADIRGIKEPGVFHEVGQPNLTVKLDRDRSAHYGLKTDDVGGIVQAALGGRTVTQIFETDRRFDVQAGLSPEYSLNVDSIRRIPVPTLSGGTMTLNDVADIGFTSGASYILRENGRRYIPVKFGVRGRDLDSAASEARTKIGKSIYLPVGYRLEWSGEFAALEQAKDHVAWIGVLSLLLIILLLYVFCNNVRDSVMALFDLPFAASGGILALYFAGLNLSVSAAVGFISVLGLCAVNGVLVLASYKQLQERGLAPEFAMIEACNTRMGLLFMISMSACVASLPATLSHGIGSQLQRPVATVVFGGMLMVSMLGSLFVPVIRVLLMPDRRSAEVG